MENESVARYRKRREKRLRERMNAEKDPIEKYRLLKAIYSSRTAAKIENLDGGPGSGNWGHEGRPGQLGGSSGGGGVQNRFEDENGSYTSFAKDKKRSASLHAITASEAEWANGIKSALLISKDGQVFENNGYGNFISNDTGEVVDCVEGMEARLVIPETANPNWSRQNYERKELSESRKSSAIRTAEQEKVDGALREESGKVWQSLDDDQKIALYDYTSAFYSDMNDSLRKGNPSLHGESTEKRIKNAADAIEKSELPTDIWLVRGMGETGATKFLGIPEKYLNPSKFDPQYLVGKTIQDQGFMSCGSAEGTGFGGAVKFSIYAPKGTKAIYAEPFSAAGAGGGKRWDGKSTQKYFGHEFETILQRGTKCQITGAKYQGNTLHVEMQVVGQDSELSKPK